MQLRILMIFCLCTTSLSAQEPFSQNEMEVKNMIRDLPEVKAKNKVYDSITKRIQEVKMRITPPTAETNLYKVEVGYQGSGRFEPHFYFFVNPETKLIYIEDTKQGDRPTLSEWRNRQSEGYEKKDSTNEMTDTTEKPKPVDVYPGSP